MLLPDPLWPTRPIISPGRMARSRPRITLRFTVPDDEFSVENSRARRAAINKNRRSRVRTYVRQVEEALAAGGTRMIALRSAGFNNVDLKAASEFGIAVGREAAVARRTAGRTGILIYLSMGEHRAEIVADEAIARLVSAEVWGEAMATLLADVREGRPGEGICAAIEQIGQVLAEHFPKTAINPNEIPDKLIEL